MSPIRTNATSPTTANVPPTLPGRSQNDFFVDVSCVGGSEVTDAIKLSKVFSAIEEDDVVRDDGSSLLADI